MIKFLLQKYANSNVKLGKQNQKILAITIWWSKKNGNKPDGEIIKLLTDTENDFLDNQ